MSAQFELDVTGFPRNRVAFALAGSLEERVKAIIKHFPVEMAWQMLAYLDAMAPKDMDDYPALLAVRRFKVPNIDSVAGVVAPGRAHGQKLTRSDVPRTVLFIRPRMVSGRAVDPAAVLLSEYNPWTMGTLPYEPSKLAATIMSRRVRANEVAEIERRRTLDRMVVDRQVRELGKIPARKDPVLLERRVIRDLAFEILRREYGLGDAPHVAHWRPAVRLARGTLVKRVLKTYLRWLAVPSEQRWRRKPMGPFGNPKEVKRFAGFQKYVRA